LLTNAGQEIVVVDGAQVRARRKGAGASLFQRVERVANGGRVIQRRERSPHAQGVVGRQEQAAASNRLGCSTVASAAA